MPQSIRVCINRRKKVQVLPMSSTKVTTEKVRECFARSNAIINIKGIALNENVTVQKFPSRSSYRNKIVCCSAHGPHRHFLNEQIMEDRK